MSLLSFFMILLLNSTSSFPVICCPISFWGVSVNCCYFYYKNELDRKFDDSHSICSTCHLIIGPLPFPWYLCKNQRSTIDRDRGSIKLVMNTSLKQASSETNTLNTLTPIGPDAMTKYCFENSANGYAKYEKNITTEEEMKLYQLETSNKKGNTMLVFENQNESILEEKKECNEETMKTRTPRLTTTPMGKLGMYQVIWDPNSITRKCQVVPLLSLDDHARINAVKICQMNTSSCNENDFVLRFLKIKPGKSVCHFLTTDDMVWFK